MRLTSASAAGLSGDVSAVISVMPTRRFRDELGRERGADPAVLVLVGDREGDLGAAPGRARESRDRDRLRITCDPRDERVVRAVHPGKEAQLLVGEARLRAVEAEPP